MTRTLPVAPACSLLLRPAHRCRGTTTRGAGEAGRPRRRAPDPRPGRQAAAYCPLKHTDVSADVAGFVGPREGQADVPQPV